MIARIAPLGEPLPPLVPGSIASSLPKETVCADWRIPAACKLVGNWHFNQVLTRRTLTASPAREGKIPTAKLPNERERQRRTSA